jgi:putative flippase GtrA
MSLPVQFIVYLLVSSLAAVTSFVVGFLLYGVLGLSAGVLYYLALAIGWLAGLLVNMALQRAITFRDSERARLAAMRTFVVIAGVGLVLTIALAALFRAIGGPQLSALLVPLAGPSLGSVDSVAQALALAIVAVFSFAGHKWITFARGIRGQIARLGE